MVEIGQRVIKQAQKGKRKAYRQLVDYYHQKVYQICYIIMGDTYEAEVLARETFLQAFLNIGHYDPNQKFSLRLYHTAVSIANNPLEGGPSSWYCDIANTDEEMDQPADGRAIHCEKPRNIQKAMMMLPGNGRLALTLHSVDQLSLQEISNVLDVPASVIKTYIWRGREALCKL